MANFNVYSEVSRHLFSEVERRLFAYQQMRREIASYEKDRIYTPSLHSGEQHRSSQMPDPTAHAGIALADPSPRIMLLQSWLGVIDKARGEMQRFAPELARILTVFYGLDRLHGRPSRESARVRIQLMMDLNISQTTLYNWRNTCVEWVKALAIHKGLLNPELPDDPPPFAL